MEAQENKVHRNNPKPKSNANNVKAFTNKVNINFQRKQDLLEKKLHVPQIDKINGRPPYVVAIQGPPGAGKSTLLRGLIKRYSSQNIPNIQGPVTVVCNKTRRITFIQVENTIESLIDTSKIADIVILMVNAKDGLDMSTMEYIHCLQSHGMPKIISVITHLDHYKENKQQRTVKKVIKDRLWKELYGGLKVFFMSGIKYDNYMKRDLLNLTRFINTQKVRPIEYRQSHSYILVDRMEDLTSVQDIKNNPNANRSVALYGYTRGLPFNHHHIHIIGANDYKVDDISTLPDPCPLQPEKKRLQLLHKLIYAPQSDLNGIQYDKDSIYINMPQSKANPLLEELHQTALVSNWDNLQVIAGHDVSQVEQKDECDSEQDESDEESNKYESVQGENSDEEVESEHEQTEDVKLPALLESDDELLQQNELTDDEDLFSLDDLSDDNLETMFITGMHKDVQQAVELDSANEDVSGSDDDVSVASAIDKTVLINKFEAKDDDKLQADKNTFYDAQKQDMQSKFDADMAQISSLSKSDVIKHVGHLPGTYVRIRISISPEFVLNWDPNRICIIGGLHDYEIEKQYIHCRIKKHKWYPQILKTNDPVIMSMGWRRYQSVPVYMKSDSIRSRFLKYTPEFDYCNMVIYGPQIAPNTGFIAINRVHNQQQKHFRICMNGTTLSNQTNFDLKKKLKLTGVPCKIHKNTAFIKDMFSSTLEVARFENALIRTVSGIRGQIKKPCSKPAGVFRATFEDKIVMSDVVFLRTWITVPIERFCSNVDNLLLPANMAWRGMRSMRELRDALNIKPTNQLDSLYKPIERVEKKFHPLRISKKLEMRLPFASRPKLQSKLRKDSYQKKRAVVLEEHERERLGLLQQLRTLKKHQESKRDLKQKQVQAKRSLELSQIDERKQLAIREKQQKRGIKLGNKRKQEEKKNAKRQRKSLD
eukprot:NODE_34_length_31639_cov_0.254375.p1 type:complete len:934 gc:universal NODE_34_length_31639_cov_0.254375:18924-16123(-)